MNPLYARKRNVAFIRFAVGIIVFWIMFVLLQLLSESIRPSKSLHLLIAELGTLIPMVFWFQAHFFWSKSKGYPGAIGLLGCLGFLLGPLIMLILKDRIPNAAGGT